MQRSASKHVEEEVSVKREAHPVKDSRTSEPASSTGTHLNKKPGLAEDGAIDGSIFARNKEAVEDYLTSLTFSGNPRFVDLIGAMRYSLLAGGERLRPVLCMEIASSFGRDPAKVLPSAAAIELIHTFSLIHNSLPAMNTDERKSTTYGCHGKFGEATAILAGDGFFGESLALITLHQRGTPEQLRGVVRELAGAAGVKGIVGGLMLDVHHAGRGVSPEALYALHARRTGSLIEASARIGAILAGAASEDQEAVSDYARKLGLCIRASSNALNAVSAVEGPDEDPVSGAEPGKATFVQVYGLSGTWRLADKSYDEALEALERVDGDTSRLAELARFARSGAWGNPCL